MPLRKTLGQFNGPIFDQMFHISGGLTSATTHLTSLETPRLKRRHVFTNLRVSSKASAASRSVRTTDGLRPTSWPRGLFWIAWTPSLSVTCGCAKYQMHWTRSKLPAAIGCGEDFHLQALQKSAPAAPNHGRLPTSPDVAAGLSVFKKAGFSTRLFNTMQILGVAWRGNVTIFDHQQDPNIYPHFLPHLAEFDEN